MKNDKAKLMKLTIVMILVFAGVLFFYIITFRKEDFNFQHIAWIGIVFVVLIFSIIVFLSRLKDVKKGMPLEDERSKKVLNMASSRGFYVTLYLLLGISIFEKLFADIAGVEQLDAGHVVGIAILGMTIVFICFWFYFNKKANL